MRRTGPVLIFAGAGSGKTRALTYRIAHMIDNCGISPGQILAVTFTNKAANEMRERIQRISSAKRPRKACGWAHSTPCAPASSAPTVTMSAWSPEYTIFDESDQTAIVKEIRARLEVTLPERDKLRGSQRTMRSSGRSATRRTSL
jgi:DNA helicase-2/ATP-dependent DNA helicase PcrA